MSRSRFTFAGKSSDELYLTVEKLPTITAPEKRYTTITVPGRNGELHMEENAFRSYIQPYECWFRAPCAAAPQTAHAIKEWLLGSRGIQILRDSYDPDYFRKAVYLGPMDMERLLNEYGRCTIQFSCSPQAFLCSGQRSIGFSTAGTLRNPTPFTALPLITVYGTIFTQEDLEKAIAYTTGNTTLTAEEIEKYDVNRNGDVDTADVSIMQNRTDGTVTVGGITVQIRELTDVLILDCESMNAYRQTGEGATENKNNTISAPVFPELAAGDNAVSWTGGVERVEIIPRWWTL